MMMMITMIMKWEKRILDSKCLGLYMHKSKYSEIYIYTRIILKNMYYVIQLHIYIYIIIYMIYINKLLF